MMDDSRFTAVHSGRPSLCLFELTLACYSIVRSISLQSVLGVHVKDAQRQTCNLQFSWLIIDICFTKQSTRPCVRDVHHRRSRKDLLPL